MFLFKIIEYDVSWLRKPRKSPLDIKIASYLDVKVPFQGSREEDDGLIQNKKEMKRKHKMERKEMVKMWEARHYKARLEAMETLKMSGCVPPLAMQDKA